MEYFQLTSVFPASNTPTWEVSETGLILSVCTNWRAHTGHTDWDADTDKASCNCTIIIYSRTHTRTRTHTHMHARTCKQAHNSTRCLFMHDRAHNACQMTTVCMSACAALHDDTDCLLYIPGMRKRKEPPRKRRGKERGMSAQGEWNTADTKWHFLPKPLRVKGWWLFPGSSICRAIYMLLRRLMFFYFFLKFFSSFYFFLIFFLRNVTCLLVIVTWFLSIN